VVANVARTADAIGADMLYWDGSERLQGDHWYYKAKQPDLYYRTVANKDIALPGLQLQPWSRHNVSRTASADGHGDVKGYSSTSASPASPGTAPPDAARLWLVLRL